MSNPAVAILCSDLHLQSRTPRARKEDKEKWFDCMRRALQELQDIQKKHTTADPPLIFCAGDIFDRWNPSPELVNFAARHLPTPLYAIPGQHDLPYNNIYNLEKSAFYTLILGGTVGYWYPIAKALYNLIEVNGVTLRVDMFPYGESPSPNTPATSTVPSDTALNIALVHRFIWSSKENSYPGASKDSKAHKVLKEMPGYDVVVSGDNHRTFQIEVSGRVLYNPGALLRRSADEFDRKPSVGILRADGSVETEELQAPDFDEFNQERHVVGSNDFSNFLDDLRGLDKVSMDFEDKLRHVIEQFEDPLKKEIALEVLENVSNR